MSINHDIQKHIDYFERENNNIERLKCMQIEIEVIIEYYTCQKNFSILKKAYNEENKKGMQKIIGEKLKLFSNRKLIDRAMNIKDEIQKKIRIIESKEEEIEYFARIGYIYLNQDDTQKHTEQGGGIEKYLNIKKISNKGEIYEKYLDSMDNGYKSSFKNRMINEDICENCGCDDIRVNMVESITTCMNCGFCGYYQNVSPSAYSYDENREKKKPSAGYKRKNHFNQWLRLIQSEESTQVHESVIDDVVKEFKKYNLFSPSDVTLDRVKYFLRKCGHNDCYEHAAQIKSRISGIPPPYFTPHQEETLRQMFELCQEPFEKCPDSIKRDRITGRIRRNFPSYSYILYKFCELLGYNDFIQYFGLLKSIKKLEQHDDIWRFICNYRNWDFYETSIVDTKLLYN